ncbi:MAG TPA: SpoIIE family protein phosphatase [Candidatus Baltobacteraceae bacterium]|jgi:PAS domain S-box-containing protein|nr:SpoIIE family protein phosphatase [Candidatus Baltobacteraceae bacterium]
MRHVKGAPRIPSPPLEVGVADLTIKDAGTTFHAVLDAIPQIAWISGADGTVQFYNRRWIEYTGVRVDEKGQGENVIHADDREQMWERWRNAVKTGEPFDVEYRLLHAQDGSYRWFKAQAVPLHDSTGNVCMWLGLAADIDEQKRANEKLRFVLEAQNIFSSSKTTDAIADQFARLAIEQFADWCFIVLADSGGRYAVSSVQHRDREKIRLVWEYASRFPIGDDPRFTAFVEQRAPLLLPVITPEMLATAARDEEHLELLRKLEMHSGLLAPLFDQDELLGAILMYTAESGRAFDESDVEVVKMLTQRAASSIARLQKIGVERRARARLQFISRAAETIYESLDLAASFGELVRLIAQTFGDFAVAARIERETMLRVIAASHRDPQRDDAARALVGVRPFHPEAEKKFIEGLKSHKAVAGPLDADLVSRSTWPYLASEVGTLAPQYAVAIPLYSRGTTYGAIVAYSSDGGRGFSADEVEVLVEIGRHASVAMENVEVFERERRMAQTLQDSLLPPSLPKIKGLRLDSVYLPSETDAQVGGDWYDAFTLEDGTLVVSTGDVTGRGPKAAVIMGKVRHLIAIAPSYERDPSRILDTVEQVLARRYPDAIVTAFLGMIDPDRRAIQFANAGHPYPLLRTKSGTIELTADGLPIGLRRTCAPAQSRTVELADALMLVMYTDGLVESTHDVLEGYARLHSVVESDAVLHTHNPAGFIEESCLKGRADDDVAVLTVSFEPTVRWAFDAENARAAQDARTQFVRYLRANGTDPEDIGMAELIFGELVGNVVRHSPGPIDINLDWSNDRPVLHVLDRGPEFVLTRALPEDVLSESGRGLFIVKALSGDIRVEHISGYGNHVVVELPLRRKVK